MDDGTAGLLAIKQRGGVAVVQDPTDALYPNMPKSALAHVNVDYCVPVVQIGPTLVQLTREEIVQENIPPASDDMKREVRIVGMETNSLSVNEQVGSPSAYSCPECGGVLWKVYDAKLTRFRCRTGHAFSPESALAEQYEKIEQALWVALKTLDENASLSRHMAEKASQNGHLWFAERLDTGCRRQSSRQFSCVRCLHKKRGQI